jgi:hypothetical protein
LRRSDHAAIAARTVSRGISGASFMRDLFRISRLLWRYRQAMSSETAHSL